MAGETNSSAGQKVNKAGKLPLIAGLFLALTGLSNLGNTVTGGLFIIAGGLLMVPKLKVMIQPKLPAALSKPTMVTALSVVFLVLGFGITGFAIKNANLDDWNKRSTQISSEISDAIDSNKLSEAKSLIAKYERVVIGDAGFDGLKSKYQAAQAKADAEAKAKAEEETKAKSSNLSSTTNSSEDPDMVGKCLGYIGMEIKQVGATNIHHSHQRYLSNHQSYAATVIELQNSYPSCFSPGAMIGDCLAAKGVSQRNIVLAQGFNTGIVSFRGDSATKAIFETACME